MSIAIETNYHLIGNASDVRQATREFIDHALSLQMAIAGQPKNVMLLCVTTYFAGIMELTEKYAHLDADSTETRNAVVEQVTTLLGLWHPNGPSEQITNLVDTCYRAVRIVEVL